MTELDAKLKWIKRPLEMATMKWPARGEALRSARRISQLSDKRTKWEYQCNHCKDWFKSKYIQLDHVVPKGKYSQETFFNWVDKLLPSVTGWQVLCVPCHKIKSANEAANGEYR